MLFGGFAVFAADETPDFTKDIKPILQKHCYDCHNGEKHKGDLDLTKYETFDEVKASPDVFATALERIQAY
jgi:hypothetical protein